MSARPGQVRLPRLARRERLRLWLSYQRYGLALVSGGPALVVGVAWLAPWWLAAVVALPALAPIGFGVQVLARWPRKLRATEVAIARQRAGRFRDDSVRGYCGDPCFRVVADEILRRAGRGRAERAARIAEFREQVRREGDMLILVDRVGGTVVTVTGDGQLRRDAIPASR